MSESSTHPNFFLLLGLNPDAKWDQEHFEKILRQKRVEWSRQSAGVARKALVAQQNLALVSQMQEVMTDPAMRQREAQMARRELAATRQAEHAHFEKQLALLNAKELVADEEKERFLAAFEHLLSREEILSRLHVRSEQTPIDQNHSILALDPSLVKNIADRLQFLRIKTLYDLPGCSRGAATKTLYHAAEQLYKRLVMLAPSAEVTAKIELAGLAREVFKSDAMRAAYDESLRMASLDQLLSELDESMQRSPEKEVHLKQVQLFLQEAHAAGWQEEEALERLKDHARQRRWIMTLPSVLPPPETPPPPSHKPPEDGTRPVGRIVITYTIKTSSFWRPKRALHLHIDPSGQPLPALVIISKEGRLPFGRSDGELFHRIEACVASKGHVVIPLSDVPLARETFGKLFLEDDALYGEFVVHHPDEKEMRLG